MAGDEHVQAGGVAAAHLEPVERRQRDLDRVERRRARRGPSGAPPARSSTARARARCRSLAERPHRVLARDQRGVAAPRCRRRRRRAARRAGPRSRRATLARRGRRGARARRARPGRRRAPARRRRSRSAGRPSAGSRPPTRSAATVGRHRSRPSRELRPRPRPACAGAPPGRAATRSPGDANHAHDAAHPRNSRALAPCRCRRIPSVTTPRQPFARPRRPPASVRRPRPSPARAARCPTPAPAPGPCRRARPRRRAPRSASAADVAEVDPARDPHVHEHLRARGSSARRAPTAAGRVRAHQVGDEQAGEQAVAGRREVARTRCGPTARRRARGRAPAIAATTWRSPTGVSTTPMPGGAQRAPQARGSTSRSPRSRRCAARRARAGRARSSP